ncbi:MAG: hypothetical protein MMC33_007140 [Icmadophila ericetorum]|nr:hypothetical protein [Icmadophila ericetorum]
MAGLIAAHEKAEDVAAAFNKFRDPVFEHATDITALIAELFHFSSSAQELHKALREPRYTTRKDLIAEDLRTLLLSTDRTFDDINDLFGKLSPTGRLRYLSNEAAYRAVWDDITDHFEKERTEGLFRRLQYYKRFLQDLTDVVKGYGSSRETSDLRYRIENILRAQETTLETGIGRTSLGTPAPRRSYERVRAERVRPPVETRRRPPAVNTNLWDEYGDYDEFSPTGPDILDSPVTATSSSETSSTRSVSDNHWVPNVFLQGRPTTAFVTTGQASACYGPHMPGAGAKIAQDYDKLLELPFESGELIVKLYVRQSDLRARILCRTLRGTRTRTESSLPLTHLKVVRRDSSLQLLQRRPSRQSPFLWACLRFPSYERMVLFHCSLISLKAQDACNPVGELRDHVIVGEELIYSGVITDDSYQHSLQILKDKDSDGVRLQASVIHGEMKKMPVWTAFITYQILTPTWMFRASRKIIQLRDLQRYIFRNAEDYEPSLGPNGEQELSFDKSQDAEDFMASISDLVDEHYDDSPGGGGH